MGQAWPHIGSAHFPGQYTLLIENFGNMKLGQRRKTCPASWDDQFHGEESICLLSQLTFMKLANPANRSKNFI